MTASLPRVANGQTLTLADCQAIVAAGVPPLPQPNPEYFAKVLRTLLAVLPRRAADEMSGELLINAYRRKLGTMPDAQITFMADQALERCKWFPTIAECVEIAGEWVRNDRPMREYRRASMRVQAELMSRYDALMSDLAGRKLSQKQIDGLPERLKEAAFTYGYLHRAEGVWTYRPERVLGAPSDAADEVQA